MYPVCWDQIAVCSVLVTQLINFIAASFFSSEVLLRIARPAPPVQTLNSFLRGRKAVPKLNFASLVMPASEPVLAIVDATCPVVKSTWISFGAVAQPSTIDWR